ncbi:phage tail family protein [Bacillus sp. FJAT-49732]|uniref:Phage tail family protein n=1 Tax=Lederbergia citrisecunda TaxID=2833583 RepID=A0A942YLS7_9BACI|nr:distal tail protein Dit [Lederbergia citrisecunda]MBS4198621.1 phage tail family protein [Lederbergia citrisecunda]
MIFNGVEKSYLTVLRGKKRPPITKIEHEYRQKTKTGARIKKTRLEVLEIDVPVLVIPPKGMTLEQVKEDLSGWLFHKDDKQLKFKDNPQRFYNARLQDIDLEDKQGYADGNIIFVCQDPFRQSLPKSLNLTTTNQTFTIGGQTETPWTSRTRFTVPQSSFTLENNKGGKIILSYNFIAGDVLEIDYDKRDVKLNGKDLAVAIGLSTVWFELPVGQIQLKASHATELMYSERYY